MYVIFTYIWLICMVNVGKYTLHGSYGVLRSYVAWRNRLGKKHVLLPGSLTAHPRILAKHQEEKIVFQSSFFRTALKINILLNFAHNSLEVWKKDHFPWENMGDGCRWTSRSSFRVYFVPLEVPKKRHERMPPAFWGMKSKDNSSP